MKISFISLITALTIGASNLYAHDCGCGGCPPEEGIRSLRPYTNRILFKLDERSVFGLQNKSWLLGVGLGGLFAKPRMFKWPVATFGAAYYLAYYISSLPPQKK